MKRTFLGLILISLTLTLYTSCSRIETTDLGGELIPAVDNVNTFLKEFDVETDNVLALDTTRMFNLDYAIGIIANDPEFGRTEAITYFAIEPAQFGNYPFIKRDTVYVDSVVLSLAYAELYGDSNSVQRFEVREMQPGIPFRADSAYRLSREEFPTLPEVLGSKQVNFTTLNDSVYYRQIRDTVRSINELRIRLDTSFGRRFVNYDTSNAYRNDSIFKTLFKGFEVRSSDGSPLNAALAYFDLSNTDRTKLTFYCRVMNNGRLDTIAPTFTHAFDPKANLVRRTPGGPYQTYLANGGANDDLLYLQSTPGSYARITIPALDTFAQTNRVIHRAELVSEVVPSTAASVFTPPVALFLDAVNAAGDTAFTILNDFIPANEQPGYDITTFGGILRNNNYVFNISRYMQAIVTRKFPIYTLRLYAPFVAQPYYLTPTGVLDTRGKLSLLLNTQVGSGRVVLGGGSHPSQKMKLRIIYSDL